MEPGLSALLISRDIRFIACEGGAGISGITADSRKVKAGDLFVCMPSPNRDTHEFLDAASAAGAVAALVHSAEGFQKARSLGLGAAQLSPEPARFNLAVSLVAARLLNEPSEKLRVIGITGTNGKTTTAWMLRDALRALGRRAGYMGTLGVDTGSGVRELSNTTPFPVEFQTLLAEAVNAGVQDLPMEVSSHALAEERVSGTRFDVGLFTNLTQDHLDFHGSMEAYADAKKLLFTRYAEVAKYYGKRFVAAINIGDACGRAWAPEFECPVVTYGATDAALVASARKVEVAALELEANFDGRTALASLKVGGLFNVQNATSALAGLLALGYGLEEACHALESVTPVPGRFEAVPNDRGIGVIVDYAHTPDALEQLLKSARALNPSRIITVFGCGGDRDRTKRPRMARTVSEHSDVTVVTSDNPRTEDPLAIIADITPGLVEGAVAECVPDRREAIAKAVSLAQTGDMVVIAGKGHEDYQIIGRTKHHMDDREMAREALEALR